MRLLTAAVAVFALSCVFAVHVSSAQSPGNRTVTVPGSELRTLKSSSTGRSYDLYIHKPAHFDASKDKKYPVLYLLDGQWDFKLLDSVVGGLVYDRKMPDIVVVGITYSGDHADYGALYAMVTDPSLFWGYLAGSPDFNWDDNFVVKQEAEFATKHKNLPVRLFLAVGGDEELVTPSVSFVRTLSSRNYEGLHWDGRVIEGEGHS